MGRGEGKAANVKAKGAVEEDMGKEKGRENEFQGDRKLMAL